MNSVNGVQAFAAGFSKHLGFSSRESTVMIILFKSLVISRLDYGSQIGSPMKIHQIIMKKKKIQKAFTKHIKEFSSFSYQERLSNLKIYSLQRRRERYISVYSNFCLENSGELNSQPSQTRQLSLCVLLMHVDYIVN